MKTLKDLFRTTTFAGWVLLARSVIYLIFSRRRDMDSYAAIDASAIIFILYAVLAFYVGYKTIFQNNHRFGRKVLFNSPLKWFILYSFLGIASMMWSVAPSLSGFRAFECIAMMLLIVAVIQQLIETGNLKYVILWSLFYCTWDIFFALIRASKWAASLGTLLAASQMMATTFFFMALYFTPRKWYNYLIMVMSIFSMSTVAYIGMALGAVSAFWTNGKAKAFTILCSFILLIALIWVGPYKLVKDTIFFDKNDISMEETSGRDKLMDLTIDCVKEHPLGLGFFAAEPYVIYSTGQFAISAHNSLFSAGMGLGIPGIIVFSIFLMSLGLCVISKYIPRMYKPICIGCFSVAFLHCMGNPSVGTRVYGAWMPGMYIFVLVCAFYIYGRYYNLNKA